MFSASPLYGMKPAVGRASAQDINMISYFGIPEQRWSLCHFKGTFPKDRREIHSRAAAGLDCPPKSVIPHY